MDNAQPRNVSTPMILGLVGGFMLAIGSFLKWATATVNFDRLAAALGIDPAQIPGSVRAQSTFSVKGWDDWGGKATLVAGIVVLVVAVLLLTITELRVLAAVIVVAGAAGGGVGVYYATVKVGQVRDAAAGSLTGTGLPGQVSDYLSVSVAIGLWLCIIGGVVAIVGGIVAMMSGKAAAPAMSGMPGGAVPPPMSDSGFGTSSVAGSMAAPVSSPPPPMPEPAMPEPAMPEPVTPPVAAPTPPSTDATAGAAEGDTTTS
jgi:hypothetical protein